jgi:hypothetical protein
LFKWQVSGTALAALSDDIGAHSSLGTLQKTKTLNTETSASDRTIIDP